MYSGRSATPTVHRMPSNADPSPRAAGQSALPHDRRVQRASPGQTWAPPAGNSPVYGSGWEFPLPVVEWVAGKPGCRTLGRVLYISYSSPEGGNGITLYGYARASVREPEDRNLDLQVERLVRAGCAMGNIRAEETSEAKDDWGGLLELHPLMGDLLYSLSYAELRAGLATDAARRIEHAIAQYPDHPNLVGPPWVLTTLKIKPGSDKADKKKGGKRGEKGKKEKGVSLLVGKKGN